jgi:hypothetical protein
MIDGHLLACNSWIIVQVGKYSAPSLVFPPAAVCTSVLACVMNLAARVRPTLRNYRPPSSPRPHIARELGFLLVTPCMLVLVQLHDHWKIERPLRVKAERLLQHAPVRPEHQGVRFRTRQSDGDRSRHTVLTNAEPGTEAHQSRTLVSAVESSSCSKYGICWGESLAGLGGTMTSGFD